MTTDVQRSIRDKVRAARTPVDNQGHDVAGAQTFIYVHDEETGKLLEVRPVGTIPPKP